jgi:hypothetical protein
VAVVEVLAIEVVDVVVADLLFPQDVNKIELIAKVASIVLSFLWVGKSVTVILCVV